MKLKEIKKSNLIFMDEVPQNEVKKIIDKIEKKPITSYYKFSLIGNTQNDVEKDDLGYMVEYDKVKLYKKNKVYAYDGYGKMNNSIINMNIAFKAEYPFNLIYASSTLKEEDKIITSNDLFYEKDELYSKIKILKEFLDNEIHYALTELIEDKYNLSLLLGTRVKVKSFSVGLRYERGLNNNELLIINANGIDIDNANIDTTTNKLSLNISYDIPYDLFKKKD